VSRYKKGKSIWILLKQETVSGSGISWAICICTSLQTYNHASTPPLSFLQARWFSCRPTNSVKALKAKSTEGMKNKLVKNIVTHFSSKGSVTPSVSVLKVAVKYN